MKAEEKTSLYNGYLDEAKKMNAKTILARIKEMFKITISKDKEHIFKSDPDTPIKEYVEQLINHEEISYRNNVIKEYNNKLLKYARLIKGTLHKIAHNDRLITALLHPSDLKTEERITEEVIQEVAESLGFETLDDDTVLAVLEYLADAREETQTTSKKKKELIEQQNIEKDKLREVSNEMKVINDFLYSIPTALEELGATLGTTTTNG